MATTFSANYGFDKPAVSDTGWGGIRNQNVDDMDAELFKPRIGQSALTWGATTTVDLALARVFTGTNNQISTIAFSNVPATFPNGAVVPVVRIWLIITSGAAFAITWPASVSWVKGAAPQLKASGVDIVELVTRDGGTTWYGEGTFPRFRAWRDTTDQTITTATDTVVGFQTESHDIGNIFDTGTNRFTVPAGGDSGVWLLHGQVRWAANATGTRRLWIRKNGTQIMAEASQIGTSSLDHNQEVSFTIHRPTVTDYYELICRHTVGSDLAIRASVTVGAYTYFEGTRLA